MPRLFIAVWPPADVVDRLAALPRLAIDGLRWTRPDQWHVTLRFLGWVEDASAVEEVLDSVPLPAATATVGPALGRFGQRILHVPVAGLEQVAAAVISSTAGLGEPPEDRPFSGHITLARVGNRARVDLRPLVGHPIAGTWPVADITLVASTLSKAGARYEVVRRFPDTVSC